MEKFKRSITKTLTYKIVGTLILMALAYYVLDIEFKTSAAIGGMDFVTKLILYYWHERIWARINWGNGESSRNIVQYIIKQENDDERKRN